MDRTDADAGDDDEFAGFTGGSVQPGPRSDGERGRGEDGRTADVPGWYERTPSGWRNRDINAAREAAARDKAKQQIEQHTRVISSFSGVQFIGHLAGGDIKFTRNGDLVLQFIVPYQFKDLAIPLTDAFGIPLHVDVQIWKPYQERRNQQAANSTTNPAAS